LHTHKALQQHWWQNWNFTRCQPQTLKWS